MDIQDLVEDRCTFSEFGCRFKPVFGFPDQKATRCGYHREDGMICIEPDKRLKLCLGCRSTAPSFNYKDQTKPLYCSRCAYPSMVNIKYLRGRKCNRCDERITDLDQLFCQKCIDLNLIDPESEYCCDACKTEIARFNYKKKLIPIRCEKCRLDSMVEVSKQKRKRKRVDDQDLPNLKRSKVEITQGMYVENKNTGSKHFMNSQKVEIIRLRSGVEVYINTDCNDVIIKNGSRLITVCSNGSVYTNEPSNHQQNIITID